MFPVTYGVKPECLYSSLTIVWESGKGISKSHILLFTNAPLPNSTSMGFCS